MINSKKIEQSIKSEQIGSIPICAVGQLQNEREKNLHLGLQTIAGKYRV